MSFVERIASAIVFAGLAWLVVRGLPDRPGTDGILRVTSETSLAELTEAIAPAAGQAFAYDDTVPPTAGAVTALRAALSQGGHVTLRVSGQPPRLTARLAPGLTAMRRAALTVTLTGGPTADPLVVEDESGGVDTLTLLPAGEGTYSVSAAVEPTRGGSSTWTVRRGSDEVRLRGWARPASDVRVLIWTGLPDWESRTLVRALESTGMAVDVRQELGRGLTVSGGAEDKPATVTDLNDIDVVVLMSPPEEAFERLLDRWVQEDGGGLLRAHRSGTPPSTTPSAASRRVAAAELEWAGPVEIVPLPSGDDAPEVDVEVRAVSPDSPTGNAAPVVMAPEGAAGTGGSSNPARIVATTEWRGRGRVYVSGVETWPWVMEAGLVEEHAAHWESVVEWLAGGLRSSVEVTGPPAVVGSAWSGRVFHDERTDEQSGSRGEGLPDTRELLRPGSGVPESLMLESNSGPGRRIRFVPTVADGHALGVHAHHGVPVSVLTEVMTWSEAALALGQAGARILSLDDAAPSGSATLGAPRMAQRILFAAMVAALLAMWLGERLRRPGSE